jgi:hypothetical protein
VAARGPNIRRLGHKFLAHALLPYNMGHIFFKKKLPQNSEPPECFHPLLFPLVFQLCVGGEKLAQNTNLGEGNAWWHTGRADPKNAQRVFAKEAWPSH